MRFKDVFSIIGPAMIGPSSSHTAGALRLGRIARQLFGSRPDEAEVLLYGSFAETYAGHGTDRAIVAGLLDFAADDPRIPHSFAAAREAGMTVRFLPQTVPAAHPNTAELRLSGGADRLVVRGASIGGGNVEIGEVDGFDVRFTGNYPTLVIRHRDRPGMIADIANILRGAQVNIGYMDLDRKSRSGDAMTVIEADGPIAPPVVGQIAAVASVHSVRIVDLTERSRP